MMRSSLAPWRSGDTTRTERRGSLCRLSLNRVQKYLSEAGTTFGAVRHSGSRLSPLPH
jgi:hypothetical protein